MLNPEATVSSLSVTTTVVGTGILVLLIAMALIFYKRAEKTRIAIFSAIVAVVLATTTTITCASVYLAAKSDTGGLVNWQARFQIWACGNQLEIRDPEEFFSNKVGTASLHEHNDNKIHLNGMAMTLPYDFSLGKFMSVIGGKIDNNTLAVPLNDTNYFVGNAPSSQEALAYIQTNNAGKIASFASGDTCGNNIAEVQAFVYRYNPANKAYEQTKIADIASYEPTHATTEDTSDCIIIEFSEHKDKTTKTCDLGDETL